MAAGTAMAPIAGHAQTLTTLFSFDRLDGAGPSGGLIYDAGQLYGTTAGGGGRDSSRGAVFRIKVSSGKEHLHSFNGNEPPASPMSGLILVNDTLYGTTLRGGSGPDCSATCGTVFGIDTKLQTAVVLHTFPRQRSSLGPYGGVIYQNGLLYGTSVGDDSSPGTVFSLDPVSGTETVLYAFTGGADGGKPYAGLTYANGILYGTTLAGGTDNLGTVFAVDPSTMTETVLHSFRGHKDGATPYAGLLYQEGELYGTTSAGGASDWGTVFKVNPGNGNEHVLFSFNGGSNGAVPWDALISEKGALFGTTAGGGTVGDGTVFTLDPRTGSETVLYSFTGGSDGANPYGPLLYHAGAFYGTTSTSGGGDAGTVFMLTP
jgi:uncharacterized repeat protein (TIGR03803 family)